MIERHRDKFRFAAGLIEVVPQRDVGVGGVVPSLRFGLGVRHDDQLLQGGQAF